ncbi:MAG: hypothetical protein IAE82_12575 [Opitutaceae bacterium]|nr:hypothetical protein [Opitutaceae bacterium]
MNTHLARRAAANIRATLVILAFTTLAAVGFATTKSLRPTRMSASPVHGAAPALASTGSTAMPHAAPAACPMPAGVFTGR